MFKQILADLRKKAGLSQDELARLAKLSKDHIAKLEQGRRNAPKKKTLIKITNALDLKKEERNRLFSAAGYSPLPLEPVVYYHPSVDKELEKTIKPNDEIIKSLSNPAVRLVADVLKDIEIPAESRKEIEKMIISFARWLKYSKEEEIYKKSKNK